MAETLTPLESRLKEEPRWARARTADERVQVLSTLAVEVQGKARSVAQDNATTDIQREVRLYRAIVERMTTTEARSVAPQGTRENPPPDRRATGAGRKRGRTAGSRSPEGGRVLSRDRHHCPCRRAATASPDETDCLRACQASGRLCGDRGVRNVVLLRPLRVHIVDKADHHLFPGLVAPANRLRRVGIVRVARPSCRNGRAVDARARRAAQRLRPGVIASAS